MRAITVACLLVSLLPLPSLAQSEVLQEGDELLLLVPTMKPPRRKVSVDLDGQIPVLPYGRVHVSGLTLKAATLAITAHLKKYIVNVKAVRLILQARAVLVTGQVANPGMVKIGERADVWQAIQRAGGLSKGADLRRVILVHEGTEHVIDLRAYLTRERVGPLPTIASGDTVFVPAEPGLAVVKDSAAPFLGHKALQKKVFVLGEVKNAGLYDKSPDLSPLMAIALAGGPTGNANLSGVRLIAKGISIRVNVTRSMVDGTKPTPIPADGGVILYVPARGPDGEDPFGPRVSVFGGVTKPGRYPLSGPMRLVDVLGMAGGPSKDGDLNDVRVMQQGDGFTLVARYDVDRFTREGGIVGLVMVNPGDVVFVDATRVDAWKLIVGLIGDLAIISAAVVVFAGI